MQNASILLSLGDADNVVHAELGASGPCFQFLLHYPRGPCAECLGTWDLGNRNCSTRLG